MNAKLVYFFIKGSTSVVCDTAVVVACGGDDGSGNDDDVNVEARA